MHTQEQVAGAPCIIHIRDGEAAVMREGGVREVQRLLLSRKSRFGCGQGGQCRLSFPDSAAWGEEDILYFKSTRCVSLNLSASYIESSSEL